MRPEERQFLDTLKFLMDSIVTEGPEAKAQIWASSNRGEPIIITIRKPTEDEIKEYETQIEEFTEVGTIFKNAPLKQEGEDFDA